MDVRGMHYDFKQKLNKLDSNQNRNLLVPEIDWKLNEAVEVFVKLVAAPRSITNLGFEVSQRSIDDIRTLVVPSKELVLDKVEDNKYYFKIPDNYSHFIKAEALGLKDNCPNKTKLQCTVRQHDDRFLTDSFTKPSFEWREVPITFSENHIVVYTDGTFSIDSFRIHYIKRHSYIHNAQDYPGGKYKLSDGTLLVGKQDCELPEITHREIVDIAVLITSGDLSLADFQTKLNKIQINKLN